MHIKAFIIGLIALLLAVLPAAAQTGTPKTPSALNTEINTFFLDNTSGLIIPQNARQTLLDMVASMSNLAVNQQTGNYTIQTSDCGGIVYATGGTKTITLPATTGFSNLCAVSVYNGDIGTLSGGTITDPFGKILSGFPSTLETLLFPTQFLTVQVIGGSWVVARPPVRWKLYGNLNMVVTTTGSNATGDCLLTSASAPCATQQYAWDMIARNMDLQQKTVTVFMGSGTYTTGATITCGAACPGATSGGINFSSLPPGSCATCITFTSLTGVATDVVITASDATGTVAVYMFAQGYADINMVSIANLSVSNATGDCIRSEGGSTRVVGVRFGQCKNAAMYAKHNGFLLTSGTITFDGPCNQTDRCNSFVVAQTNAIAIIEFSTFVYSIPMTAQVANIQADAGQIWAALMTFTNPTNMAGPRYSVSSGGVILTGSAVTDMSTYFPGDQKGTSVGPSNYEGAGVPTAVNCGNLTAPVTAGTDRAGKVTVGAAAAGVSSCTIQLTQAHLNLRCQVSWSDETLASMQYTPVSTIPRAPFVGGMTTETNATILISQTAKNLNTIAWRCEDENK